MRNIKTSRTNAKAANTSKAKAKPDNTAQLAVAASTNDKLESGKRVATPFAKHDLKHTYAGASAPFTSRKSRTPIEAEFNRLAGYGLTDRDNAFLASLKAKYGKAEFSRLNCDAGNLRRAIERGYINYGKAANTFALTQAAHDTKFA